MTLPTFTPPVNSDEKAVFEKNPNVLKANLGDGYVQRVVNGINPILRKQTLNWTNLTNAQAVTIDTFFSNQLGAHPFLWTPNGESTARVFVCSSWKLSYKNGGYADITNAVFEEAAAT